MEKNLKGFKETQKIPASWFNPPKIPSRDTRKLSRILSLFWIPKKVPAEINLPKKILAEILLSNFQTRKILRSFLSSFLMTATNHNRSKQHNEPITIPSNYLYLAQSAGKIMHTWCDWFWFCLSLVEKLALVFWANHLAWQSQSHNQFRQSFENCSIVMVSSNELYLNVKENSSPAPPCHTDLTILWFIRGQWCLQITY